MEREILVHAEMEGTPVLVGRLWVRVRRGRESASFEYDRAWLRRPDSYSLEPALSSGPGAFHTRKALFGAIGDSAPDRGGRVLLRRAEVRRARMEGRAPRTLLESDFLLLVDDELRAGALRFRTDPDGPFLAEPRPGRVPPLVGLGRLLDACDRVTRRDELDEDLRLLIGPGSSLGGARPKAAIRDRDGALAIAKFPHHGFLYERDKGWRLSPAFDLNPAPTDERARVLATNIDEHDGTASLDLALGTATYYGLDPGDAGRVAGEVGRAVGGWREVAGEMGATRRESDRMESAFSHEDLEGAQGLG